MKPHLWNYVPPRKRRTHIKPTNAKLALALKPTYRHHIPDIQKCNHIEYDIQSPASLQGALKILLAAPGGDPLSHYNDANIRHVKLQSVLPSLLDSFYPYPTTFSAYKYLCNHAPPPLVTVDMEHEEGLVLMIEDFGVEKHIEGHQSLH